MSGRKLSFANFVCKFGEQKELLDYVEEIILPTFTDDTLVRTFGEATEYFLYEVELKLLADQGDEPIIAITGRFIKNTILMRTQIFEDGVGLIHDEEKMESSPSAFFILILNNHKLLYLPETPSAPTLQVFSSTIRNFLTIKHMAFIDELFQSLKERGERTTKKSLFEAHPKPKLTVTSLASRTSIEEFLKRYRTLKSVEITVLNPNQEIDGAAIWRNIRGMKEGIGSDKTKLVHRNPNGLKTDEAATQIHDAAAAGNQLVNLGGDDTEGNVLKGNNEHFSYSVPVVEIPESRDDLATILYGKLQHAMESGAITIDQRVKDVSSIMDRLKRLLQ
ncbi:MAG: hypothetical protein ACPGO3_00060 [Magnetospiraceae bacterium]